MLHHFPFTTRYTAALQLACAEREVNMREHLWGDLLEAVWSPGSTVALEVVEPREADAMQVVEAIASTQPLVATVVLLARGLQTHWSTFMELGALLVIDTPLHAKHVASLAQRQRDVVSPPTPASETDAWRQLPWPNHASEQFNATMESQQ